MKKTTIVIILIFLATLQVFAQNGVIREIAGTVEIKRAGAAAFTAARAGDSIAADTIVSTGFKSSALISVGSSVLTIRPLTRLSLAEISSAAGTETLNVNLQAGRVRVDVDPPAGSRTNVTVRGPTVTASVRGTSFEFAADSITVYTGVVAFQGTSGNVVLVSEGGSSEIIPNGRAADPIDISAAELMPPPYAGSDTGFQNNVLIDVRGDLIFSMILH